MKPFKEDCEGLATLNSFDPAVFTGDSAVSQPICNFVLALSLIYNDSKDAIYAHLLLQDHKPEGQFRKTRRWGAYNGIDIHLFRNFIAVIHELFNLIRSQQSLLDDPYLIEIERKLPVKSRDAWRTLRDVALNQKPGNALGRSLMLIRNKVIFHYDPKCLYRGFGQHFLDDRKASERAYISRGSNMSESRFYFADAAAIGYLRSLYGVTEADQLLKNVVDLLGPLNQALMGIVEGFVQKRAGAFREVRE